MTALIVIGSIVAYLGAAVFAARRRYAAMRPYTEPLNCECAYPGTFSSHSQRCYRRSGMIDTTGEAATFALLQGLFWWLVIPAFLAIGLVQRGQRQLPEEVEAKNARLERDLGIKP